MKASFPQWGGYFLKPWKQKNYFMTLLTVIVFLKNAIVS